MSDCNHVVFAGGATGGHLFPGIAVAEALLRCRPDCRISFCSTGKPWELSVVSRHGFEFHRLQSSPFRASPMGLLRAIYSNGVGYRAARRWVQSERPDVVVGWVATPRYRLAWQPRARACPWCCWNRI
jgi:UDP-N-acetylglucosamine--N-acetylmuramyl-(pentapeptide) pyrophosphoryl-undecaprenol N-acetylglucosamine transferase